MDLSISNSDAIQFRPGQQYVGPGGMEKETVRDLLIKAIDVGLDHRYRRPFIATIDPRRLEAIALEPMPRSPTDIREMLARLESEYLPLMPNFSSPQFAGFPDAGNGLAGVIGAVLADLLNVNLINASVCGPCATEMEIALIRWLRELLGFPVATEAPRSAVEVGGIPTTGGTMANFVATLLACWRANPEMRRTGLRQSKTKQRVLLPETIAHYTMTASMAWCGLGSDAALYAPISDFRYDLPALHDLLLTSRDNHVDVVMAVAYAGDSRTMSIERLRDFAECVKSFYPDAWLHCDGCHGTSLMFSKTHAAALNGIEHYDSVTLDPHKVLNVPYTSSFLLLREPANAELIQTTSELILRQARSFGQITPTVGTRAFTSLRTWLAIKTLGVDGIGSAVNERIFLASRFAALIDGSRYMVRLNDVSINSVIFVVTGNKGRPYTPHDAAELHATTTQTYDRIVSEGLWYLHSFPITDNRNVLGLGPNQSVHVLRFMSGNPLMTVTDLEGLVAYLDDSAAATLASGGAVHENNRRDRCVGIDG